MAVGPEFQYPVTEDLKDIQDLRLLATSAATDPNGARCLYEAIDNNEHGWSFTNLGFIGVSAASLLNGQASASVARHPNERKSCVTVTDREEADQQFIRI